MQPRFRAGVRPRDTAVAVNAVEPGFSVGTNLSRGVNVLVQVIAKCLFTLLRPFIKYASTPAQGARVIVKAALNEAKETGVYFGERGQPIQGSIEVRDPKFQDRVVAETRALLAAVPA